MRTPAALALLLLAAGPAFAGDSTLVDAIKKGDRAAVRTLATRAAVNAAEADGTTPLHYAVQANDPQLVDLLLRTGARVKVANRYGVTPLTLAVVNGNPALVERLLRAGADANAASPDGETLLMTAARVGNPAVVRLLLASGADVNHREGWLGQTALMWAAAHNHPAAVKVLVEAGADANASGAVFADYAMVPSENATPRVTASKGGMSVLHYAARQGALDAVKELVAAPGLDVNQPDPDGMTAALYATLNGHFDTAAFLLEQGANPNLADTYGRTVLYAALDMAKPEWNPRPQPRTNDTTTAAELARLALGRGANPNAPIVGRVPGRCTQGCGDASTMGATPLYRAARSADADAVRLLLEAGADPSAVTTATASPFGPGEPGGVTPLMVAAGMGWRDGRSVGTEEEAIATIELLLAAGLDVNAANDRGETALHGAAMRGADAIARFLVGKGARMDVKDRAGRTPLDVAEGVPAEEPTAANNYRTGELRESTAKVLRELMTERNVTITPYARPEAPKAETPAQ